MLWQKGRGRLGSQESAAVFCVGEIVVESGGGWLVWENTLLNCTLESIPCVNDTVIYGTMYQVRKQMGGGYIRFAMMVLAMMPEKVARRAPGRVYLVFWTLAAM